MRNITKQLAIFWVCFVLIDFSLTHFGLANGAIEVNPIAAQLTSLGIVANFVITFGIVALSAIALCFLSKLFPKSCFIALSILGSMSLFAIINNAIVLAGL